MKNIKIIAKEIMIVANKSVDNELAWAVKELKRAGIKVLNTYPMKRNTDAGIDLENDYHIQIGPIGATLYKKAEPIWIGSHKVLFVSLERILKKVISLLKHN